MLKRVSALVVLSGALGVFAATGSVGDPLLFIETSRAAPEPTTTSATTVSLPQTVPVPTLAPTTTVPATTTTTAAPTTTISPHPPGVLIIGDSILEGLNVLKYSFGPNTIYDTEVARSAVQLSDVLGQYEVPADLVVHLGTNGWWPNAGDAYSEVFAGLSDRRVLLVNLSVDRSYTSLANQELAEVAAAHPHVALIDWHAVANPTILRSDGYHPNLNGYPILARLIADGLGLPENTVLIPIESTEPALEQRATDASGNLLGG